MKATDLMIGDWVNYQPGDTPQYMKVGMVSGYDIQLDLYREGGIEVAAQVWFDEENYIQPIPLTPEILEKNGWKNAAPGIWQVTIGNIGLLWQDSYKLFLLVDTTPYEEINFRIGARIRIIAVHELQRALRVCGINDLADNFKI